MKIGNTIGPYKGLYWIDTEKKILTIRYGRVDVSSEIEIPLSENQFSHLLEIMLPAPVDIPVSFKSLRSKNIIEFERVAAKGEEFGRPKEITCKRCPTKVAVSRYGRVPRFCMKHRYVRKA